ncbi:KilA-N domain-containing protein [Pseudomonas paeninsulae]|uniref:KilA-N domain-containing protein n=1 Tax=Pseudomonas paeninsulae TaxID=3110772 RepID=UPI002D799213|nr:KilA-N domain-containing protein [Pseudomonas sp. IT1137]
MSTHLVIHYCGKHIVAISPDGFVNASLLAKHFRKNVREYLALGEVLPQLAEITEQLGRPLHAQWLDLQTIRRHEPDFHRALATSGVIRNESGDPGRVIRATAIGGGQKDFRPGLWIHPRLAADFARWQEVGGKDWLESPLSQFVAEKLAQQLSTGSDLPGACA